MLHTNVVVKLKTHIVCSLTFLESRAVYEMMWKILYFETGRRWQYGA